MSIPKVIHYCWFGKKELPGMAKKCIKSWQKYCPGYEIICWNEDNFDINCNRYVKQAYDAKKWAFVSDYVRLFVIYQYGGLYFDTDVELIKPIEPLIQNGGFMGYDEKGVISTGLGFAAEAGNEVIGELIKDYGGISFLLPDGTFDLTPCPDRNAKAFERLGVTKGTSEIKGIKILTGDYLCPMNFYTGKIKKTKNTYSIHHYCASWLTPTAKRTTFIKRIIGVKMYDKLYGKFLHKFSWLEW